MKLLSLRLKNFKSFSDVDFIVSQELTTLVGENGSGKSSIGEALMTLSQRGSIDGRSQRYGTIESSISATFILAPKEIDEWLINAIVSELGSSSASKTEEIRNWLLIIRRRKASDTAWARSRLTCHCSWSPWA